MTFDELFDLTAGVYFHFYNIMSYYTLYNSRIAVTAGLNTVCRNYGLVYTRCIRMANTTKTGEANAAPHAPGSMFIYYIELLHMTIYGI